jgi:hypothetical protein
VAAVGADQEARVAAERLLGLEPDFTLSRCEQTLQPYRDPDVAARFVAGLRSAGFPE